MFLRAHWSCCFYVEISPRCGVPSTLITSKRFPKTRCTFLLTLYVWQGEYGHECEPRLWWLHLEAFINIETLTRVALSFIKLSTWFHRFGTLIANSLFNNTVWLFHYLSSSGFSLIVSITYELMHVLFQQHCWHWWEITQYAHIGFGIMHHLNIKSLMSVLGHLQIRLKTLITFTYMTLIRHTLVHWKSHINC